MYMYVLSLVQEILLYYNYYQYYYLLCYSDSNQINLHRVSKK